MQIPQQQPNPLNILNNKINSLEWKLMALSELIERRFPEEHEQLERSFFYYKCWSYVMGREVAIRKAPLELKLQIAAANKTVIDNLRKEAIDNGMLPEFTRAEANAIHEAKEMYGR